MLQVIFGGSNQIIILTDHLAESNPSAQQPESRQDISSPKSIQNVCQVLLTTDQTFPI